MLTNDSLTAFFLQIALMLLTANIFGYLSKKMGIPTIVGELLAGLILGPTFLEPIFPEVFRLIFPNKITISTELNSLMQLGMVLYMFSSGLKINTNILTKQKRTIILTSTLGMVIPLFIGIVAVISIPSILLAPEGGDKILYAIFIGIALSISALPVIIKTLTDLELMETKIGSIIIGSATIDDVVGWTMFASLINAYLLKGLMISLSLSLLRLLLFIFIMVTLGAKVCRLLYSCLDKLVQNVILHFSITIIILALISTIAEKIGIHPFFAVFLFGIVMKKVFEDNKLLVEVKKHINVIAVGFFAPLYFTSVGLKVNFIQNFNLSLVLIMLLIAIFGKIAGASTGAMIAGERWKDALVIGVGMNSRGAIEIIVASAAVEFNIIGQQMYVSLIIIAAITSILGGPCIKSLLHPDIASHNTKQR